MSRPAFSFPSSLSTPFLIMAKLRRKLNLFLFVNKTFRRRHQLRRREQGGSNVQGAILAQWRKPYGLGGSHIPRVRSCVLLSSIHDYRVRARCRDVERRYTAAT